MKPGIGILLPTDLQAQLFSDNDRERLHTLGDVRWNENVEHLTEDGVISLKDAI